MKYDEYSSYLDLIFLCDIPKYALDTWENFKIKIYETYNFKTEEEVGDKIQFILECWNKQLEILAWRKL